MFIPLHLESRWICIKTNVIPLYLCTDVTHTRACAESPVCPENDDASLQHWGNPRLQHYSLLYKKVSALNIEKLALPRPKSTEMQGCDFVLTVSSSTNPSLAAFGSFSTQPTVVFFSPFFFSFLRVSLREKTGGERTARLKKSRGRVK